jgi:ankyrin repeat protein
LDASAFSRLEWNLTLVKLLLERGANAAAATNDGEKPLDLAKKNGRTEVIQEFLSDL